MVIPEIARFIDHQVHYGNAPLDQLHDIHAAVAQGHTTRVDWLKHRGDSLDPWHRPVAPGKRESFRREHSTVRLNREDVIRQLGCVRLPIGLRSPDPALLTGPEDEWEGATGLEPDSLHGPQRLPRSDAPAHVQADLPEWAMTSLGSTLGDDLITEGQALTQRPPVDIRANRLLSARDKVLADLPKDIGATASDLALDGIRIPAGPRDYRQPNIQAEPAFQKGWFEIQDEGSQIVAQLIGAKPGHSVLDYCAGGGGKTLALASMLENKGQIYATDSDKSRLSPIFERIKRAETRNVQVRPARSDLSDLLGAIDHVVIDAPCTGAGTWRRRPDAKWRLGEGQLQQRMKEQAEILDAAKAFVKTGGHLVYITCSLFAEENENQVASFLAENTSFKALPAAQVLASAMPSANAARFILGATGVMLTPHRTGTDGFFISLLQRMA